MLVAKQRAASSRARHGVQATHSNPRFLDPQSSSRSRSPVSYAAGLIPAGFLSIRRKHESVQDSTLRAALGLAAAARPRSTVHTCMPRACWGSETGSVARSRLGLAPRASHLVLLRAAPEGQKPHDMCMCASHAKLPGSPARCRWDRRHQTCKERRHGVRCMALAHRVSRRVGAAVVETRTT